MKSSLNVVITLCCSIALFSSCGTYRYQSDVKVKVSGVPDADFYIENQRSYASMDGFRRFGAMEGVSTVCRENFDRVGSTDSNGRGILKISTEDYNRAKKRVVVVKSGYEPNKIKLKRSFNKAYLLNILFPPAFFFDHRRVISTKKVNTFDLTTASPYTCVDYFVMAQNETSKPEILKLYKKVIEQDFRNEYGLKASALNNMAVIYGEQGKTHLAYLYFMKAREIDPNCEATANLEWLKGRVEQQNRRQQQKDQKWDNLINTLNTTGQILSMASEQISAYQAASGSQSSTTSASSGSSKSSNSSSLGHSDIAGRTRAYSNWETQLIKMNTYYETQYNDSNRKYMQGEMKKIREELAKKGYNQTKSPWEDWNGHKR